MLSIHSSSNHYEYIFSLCYMSFNAGHFSACTPSLYSSSIIQRRPLLDVLWTGDILLAGPVSCQSKRHQGSQVTRYLDFCVQDRLFTKLLKHFGDKINISESRDNSYEGVYTSYLNSSESKESLKICV